MKRNEFDLIAEQYGKVAAQARDDYGRPMSTYKGPKQPDDHCEEHSTASEEEGEGETDMNVALLDYLNQKASEIKHYKKFAKVKAYQSKGEEQIQTTLDGRNETDVRVTRPGDWVVSNVESQGEQQIVDDKTFQKRYDVANPKGDVYSPKGANFFGVIYDGSLGDNITFSPPNWGGSTMNITKGYMIGGPDPKNLTADFYGIDPAAFEKTYKPAEMVQEAVSKGTYRSKDLELLAERYLDVVREGLSDLFKRKKTQPDPVAQPESQPRSAPARQIDVSVFGREKQMNYAALMSKSETIKTIGDGDNNVELKIYKTEVPDVGNEYRDIPVFIPVVVINRDDYPRPPSMIGKVGKAHDSEESAKQELQELGKGY